MKENESNIFVSKEDENMGVYEDDENVKGKNQISNDVKDIAISAASSLVGFAIGGPVGALVGGTAKPTVKLAYEIVGSWNERRKKRVIKIVENAFFKSGKKEEIILNEMLDDDEWADTIIKMIRDLVYTDPELDELFTEIMASMIQNGDKKERNRLIVLNDAIKGLNRIQLEIIKNLYEHDESMSAKDISKLVCVPEIELRNAVRDLELRGMIIDNGAEPTIWRLRELGRVLAKTLNIWEV